MFEDVSQEISPSSLEYSGQQSGGPSFAQVDIENSSTFEDFVYQFLLSDVDVA